MNSNNNLIYGVYVYLSIRFGFYDRLLKESNYEWETFIYENYEGLGW